MGEQAQQLQQLMAFFKLDGQAALASQATSAPTANVAMARPDLRPVPAAHARPSVAKPAVKPRSVARPAPVEIKGCRCRIRGVGGVLTTASQTVSRSWKTLYQLKFAYYSIQYWLGNTLMKISNLKIGTRLILSFCLLYTSRCV